MQVQHDLWPDSPKRSLTDTSIRRLDVLAANVFTSFVAAAGVGSHDCSKKSYYTIASQAFPLYVGEALGSGTEE